MIILKKRIISAGIMLLIVIPLIILGGIPFAFAVGIIGINKYKWRKRISRYSKNFWINWFNTFNIL